MGRYPKKDDNYIEFPRTERLDLRRKRSDRTRSNILNSALRCFANAGYSATSIQDIVDDAEYTKPTLYYYFSSKSDLFTALTLHALDEHRATLEKEFQATSDLKEALINIILKLSKEAHSKTSLTRLIISSFFSADKEIPCKKKFIEIYMGRDGEFDTYAATLVKRVQKDYDDYHAIEFNLVLPYPKKDMEDFDKYYDRVDIPISAHPKLAITKRNEWMVEQAELVICYIERESGGAYKAVQYAKKLEKEIINLADYEEQGNE